MKKNIKINNTHWIFLTWCPLVLLLISPMYAFAKTSAVTPISNSSSVDKIAPAKQSISPSQVTKPLPKSIVASSPRAGYSDAIIDNKFSQLNSSLIEKISRLESTISKQLNQNSASLSSVITANALASMYPVNTLSGKTISNATFVGPISANVIGGIQNTATVSGTANAIVLNLPTAITSYSNSIGMQIAFTAIGTNTISPPTISINGLGALNTTMGSGPVPVGGVVSGHIYTAYIESSTSVRLAPFDAISLSNVSNFTPYTGATSNLDLGNYSLFASSTGIGMTSTTDRLSVAGSATFKGTTADLGLNDYKWLDSNGNISTEFDNNGRTNKFNYTGVGSVNVLYNASPTQVNGENVGHYAYGVLDINGNLQTTGTLYNKMTNVTPTSMSSMFHFGYMDAVNASSGPSFQPNKYVDIDANGMILPAIPLSGVTDITSLATGTATGAGSTVKFTMNVGGGNTGSILGQIKPYAYRTTGVNAMDFYVGGWNNAASAGSPIMSVLSNGNMGIGTTTPNHTLFIQGSGSIHPFNIASSSSATIFSLDSKEHITSNSPTPVLTLCGTSPSILGNDKWGVVTVGATTASCTLTFVNAYGADPSCNVTPQTGSVVNPFSYSHSSANIIVTQTGLGGTKFDYQCNGIES